MEKSIVEVCKNPPSQLSCAPGKGKRNEIKFYFDIELKRCKSYTDCGDSSANSFGSLKKCENECYVDPRL